MQEIILKLWCNNDATDWSVEINGLRHDHISAEIMEDLVEVAVIVAEESLANAATRQPQ